MLTTNYPNGIRRVDRQQTSSEMDYVKDGVLYKGVNAACILVNSESDLADLTGYAPGSIAHAAGWGSIWELDTDGVTWVSLTE